MSLLVLLRGGGDLASGVALRLFKAGIQVVITELPQPFAVRRSVSFAQAVYDKKVTVEDIEGILAPSFSEIQAILQNGAVPVIVDPQGNFLQVLKPHALIDGRMMKQPPETGLDAARLVIGLGPGFTAGMDCHAVIETQRGHFLGRVIWQGQAEEDTGNPETVLNRQSERVLRASMDGVFHAVANIGDQIQVGDVLGDVNGQVIKAAFKGILRGMIHDGLQVKAGMKIGDLDPRGDERLTRYVSEKSLAVGGGVLEAILSTRGLRADYCEGHRSI
ncbi:MAG: selenium-dependent molybdenum cofactor biosynthesis protein YqeB [Anaerolineaceae bacterium]